MVLVTATSVAVVLRSSVACAAAFPTLGVLTAAERSGKATFYGKAAPGGACSFPAPPADHFTAAAGPADYAAAAACGGYLDVNGTRGTVRVKVDNLCPECPPGHLDLSTEAFARLDNVVKGMIPITFHQVVDPELPGGLSFRVKEGSSQWWLALLVDNHGNPLRSVEVSSGGHPWRALERADYNYWIADNGAGSGPFRVRVTDIRGHVAVASGIAIRPGQVQRTTVRLFGRGSGGSSVTTARATAGTGTGAAGVTVSVGTSTSQVGVPRTAIRSGPPGVKTPAPVAASPTVTPADPTLAGDVTATPVSTTNYGWWC